MEPKVFLDKIGVDYIVEDEGLLVSGYFEITDERGTFQVELFGVNEEGGTINGGVVGGATFMTFEFEDVLDMREQGDLKVVEKYGSEYRPVN